MSNWTKIACWRYRTALEERAASDGLRRETNFNSMRTLKCAECRQSLDDALLATALLRDSDARTSADYSSDYSSSYSPGYADSIGGLLFYPVFDAGDGLHP